MKKFYKDHSLTVKVVSIAAILAIVVSWFFVKEMYLLKFCSVLLIDGILLFLNYISERKFFKNHDIFKLIAFVLLNIIVLSYIIPTGSYSGTDFLVGEMSQIGLGHLTFGFTFAFQQYYMQIVFLLMIGIFYGVVSKTDGYKALIQKVVKAFKGKEIGFALGISFIIALLAAILNNTLVILMFVPFLVTVLRHLGFDKIGAFVVTFGSILVGVLGAIFGTDGLVGFVSYVSTYGGSDITLLSEVAVRAGVFVLAYVLFNFFNVVYIKKTLNKKNDSEKLEDDLFFVDEPKKKKAKTGTTVFVLVGLLLLAILGFTYWNTVNLGATEETIFGLDIFERFHEWLMGLTLGGEEGIHIFQVILGGSIPNVIQELVPAFGNWYLFTYAIFILLATVIVAFVSKMKLNEFLANAFDGMKKVIRPILALVFAYMVFIFIYWVPIMPTILNEIGSLANGFNPFIEFIQAFIATFVNSDLAFIGFTMYPYLGSFTGVEANIVYLIYTTVYGLVQFIAPVSVFLLFGLSYMDIPYEKWFRYIWKFFVAMSVCLLVIFVLLTYL